MTPQENLFLAKRSVVDTIWKSARLEGINVTYPQTEVIYEGLGVSGMRLRDINIIVNLKHAWEFLIDNYDYPINLEYIMKLNRIIGENNVIINAGNIRNIEVLMGGTKWKPEIPNKDDIELNLDRLSKIKDDEERAMQTMLYLMRTQIFNDGNKRTAMLVANQILIQNGKGIFSIDDDNLDKFRELLVKFYETNDSKEICEFCKSIIIYRNLESINNTNNDVL
ncbi:Fic family protein [Campylobacter lanienae]|uniref:Fic family protein n=1 Tax=Campylobacter lanienae TaxID=75658 RepID=A0ABY3G946_9BACT|nr:Fic family protein [Campylobacter lanienae]TWO29145.1 Fic family protein [Campylobacter lanienae]